MGVWLRAGKNKGAVTYLAAEGKTLIEILLAILTIWALFYSYCAACPFYEVAEACYGAYIHYSHFAYIVILAGG